MGARRQWVPDALRRLTWGQMGSQNFLLFDRRQREAHPPHSRCGLRALALELQRCGRPPAASLRHSWHLRCLQMPFHCAPDRSRILRA